MVGKIPCREFGEAVGSWRAEPSMAHSIMALLMPFAAPSPQPRNGKVHFIRRVIMRAIIALFVVIFSGCVVINREPTRPVKMEKGSAVDLRTQLDAAELVWSSMQRLGCRQTDVIFPEVLEKTPDFQAGKGYVIQGSVKERWVAHGCNMKVPYICDFTANKKNEGGTDVYIRRESGGSY